MNLGIQKPVQNGQAFLCPFGAVILSGILDYETT